MARKNWRRYTCYVYGSDGLFSAFQASGPGMTKRGALLRCRRTLAEEPVGRDVKPAKPRFVVREER